MGRGANDQAWKDPNVLSVFDKLCHKAQRPSVDWKKFRSLDRRGIFKKYSDIELSARFRKFRLIKEGLCWQCGKEPPLKKGSLGANCYKMMRERNKTRYKEGK